MVHLVQVYDYVLSYDEFDYTIDIDECSVNNGGCVCDPFTPASNCTSFCNNVNGSFYCICDDAHELGPNNITCYCEHIYTTYVYFHVLLSFADIDGDTITSDVSM